MCECKNEDTQCKCDLKCKCFDWEEKFMELADEAWMEVLKDKIKANIVSHKSDEIQKLADIISIGNANKWENKMKLKKTFKEYKNNLKDYFLNK